MYDIYATRLVTRNGQNIESHDEHWAIISKGDDTIRLDLVAHGWTSTGGPMVRCDAAPGVVVPLADMRAALSALALVSGAAPDRSARNERAARVTERVCEILEGGKERYPGWESLAAELRAIIMELMGSDELD